MMTLLMFVLQIVVACLMAKKLGLKAWEGILPFYNIYVITKRVVHENVAKKAAAIMLIITLLAFIPYVDILAQIATGYVAYLSYLAVGNKNNTGILVVSLLFNVVTACIIAFSSDKSFVGTVDSLFDNLR